MSSRAPGSYLSRGVKSEGIKGTDVLDVIMVAIGFGFFALSIGYAIACDRL
jgi:hypothetical protein